MSASDQMLEILSRTPGRPVPQDAIERELYEGRVSPSAVPTLAAQLRGLLERDGLTVRSRNRRFVLLRVDGRPFATRWLR